MHAVVSTSADEQRVVQARSRDMTRRSVLLGIAAMCVAMFGFVANDTQIKLASEAMPLGQIIFLRGVVATVLVLFLVFATGQGRAWRELKDRAVFWRTAGDVAATVLFLTAVVNMPLSNATIVLQTVPLAVTVAGALFLRERVDGRRWVAIAVGMVGVVIVVRPGFDGFNPYSLLALLAVLFITLRDVSTHRLGRGVPHLLVVAVSMVAVMLAGGAMGFAEDWVWPEPVHLLQIAGAGVCLIIAHWFIIIALRSAPVSVTAPFGYTNVIWAILAELLIWGDRPKLLTLLGAGLVIGAGIYALYRERKVAHHELGIERSIGGAGP